VAVRFLGANN